jgi:DNA-binding NarL/FixJ family response regulator
MREGLAAIIGSQNDLEICGAAASMRESLAEIAVQRPDLVIVDLSLKDGLGLDLIKAIHERLPAQRMLVVSAYDEKIYAERALRSGALGYVNKQEAGTVLLSAIRCVLAGRRFVSDQILQRLLGQAVGDRDAESSDPVDKLTDRELEIFRLIGQGVAPGEIARRLHISPHTVDSHREKIRNKLGLENGRALMQHAMRWVFDHE